MRHRIAHKKIGRLRGRTEVLLRSLAKSLIIQESISTTLARAKSLRPYVEKLVTLGKNDSLVARKRLVSLLQGDEIVSNKILKDLGKRYNKRLGGYTRIIRCPKRLGDNASMAVIQFVEQG